MKTLIITLISILLIFKFSSIQAQNSDKKVKKSQQDVVLKTTEKAKQEEKIEIFLIPTETSEQTQKKQTPRQHPAEKKEIQPLKREDE